MSGDAARRLPEGTVTFVFTDIEGSTRLASDHPSGFRRALAEHNALVRGALAEHGGVEVRTEGDSFFCVFVSAPGAVRFAVACQRALAGHAWPERCEIRVRMGIHTGTAERADHEKDDYVGIEVHRAARIQAAAHGGQVLVSAATRVLARDVGAEASFIDLGEHRLKDLDEAEHLYQVAAPGLRREFPEVRSLSAAPSNLPDDLTTFVGRAGLLRAGSAALESSRLVTLTGPGGTGKTRLALQMGRAAMPHFADGVFFVDLASIQDSDLVASEVLGAIGLHPPAGVMPQALLLQYLSRRTMLVILDNFEQVLDAAPLVAHVLAGAPDVKLLVTSRAALHVRGERELPVPPLRLPAAGAGPEDAAASEAIALFVDRAAAVRPDFVLDESNVADVARLVARLDGLPLAIELAAARVKAFDVATILERIDRGMLAGTARDLPERQRTITAAIAWSYDLLSGPCRRLFERFSVFAGGAELDHIEEVCGPADDLGGDLYGALTELVDQSLLQAPAVGDHRYRMLATIRDFAAARLADGADEERVRARHLGAYLALAEAAAPELIKGNRSLWLDRLEADHDNIRAALAWAVAERRTDDAARLVAAVWRFWQIRGHLVEGAARIAEVTALDGGDPAARLGALEAGGGIGYWRAGPEAYGYYEEAVGIARDLGDPSRLAGALYNLSFVHALVDPDEALDMLEEARTLYEGLGDHDGLSRVEWGIGNVLAFSGDYDGALAHFQRSVDGFADSDLPFDQGWAHFALAVAYLQRGDAAAAEAPLRQSFRIFLAVDDMPAIALHLAAFASQALISGDTGRAYRLAGAMTRLRDETGSGLVDSPENVYDGLRPADLARLEGRDAAAFAAGSEMSAGAAAAYALGEPPVETPAG